ncbi:MAG: hypothetical protein ACPGVP_03585 [Thiolinea sp.]
MDQSLSITLVLEGGLAQASLSVQDNYKSPAQVFIVPLELIDFDALVNSTQHTGDYWIVTASPDNPGFQVETAVFARHHNDKIIWDLVFEHYEPFLNIELSPDADDFDENLISFTFDPFQYVSALYQACQLSQSILPTTYKAADNTGETDNPVAQLAQHIPKLNILWQKHGIAQNLLKNGQPVHQSDFFAERAETEWLQDIIATLDDVHNENVMENLDAYLESLPEDVLNRIETHGDQLQNTLLERWEMLVNSLTQEEAVALEKEETAEKYPNSLKLRLMREFLEGNPSILLGDLRGETTDEGEKVIDLQNWKQRSGKRKT